MNKENEPMERPRSAHRERPRSAHHSRRVIKYSTSTSQATGPAAAELSLTGRDHREQTSRKLTQAAKQRKMNRDKTHFPPITRDSVEDLTMPSHDDGGNSRSRPRTAKARLENGRSESASGARTRNGSVHFSDIHGRPLSRSFSAGRQRPQESNDLHISVESHAGNKANQPLHQNVIELKRARAATPDGGHLVTSKPNTKQLYQNAQINRSLVEVNLLPPSDDNRSIKSSSNKNIFVKDEVYPKPRSPQLRRSMKVIANNNLKDRLDIRYLPRPPSAKAKGRRSMSASSEGPNIHFRTSPRSKITPRKTVEFQNDHESEHVRSMNATNAHHTEYVSHNGYAHTNGEITENNHDTSGYNSNESRRNNSDDSATAYSPGTVAHLPPRSEEQPRDLISFLQQNERRMHTEFDFREEDTLRQRPKSDTVLGSRSKLHVSHEVEQSSEVCSHSPLTSTPPGGHSTPPGGHSTPHGVHSKWHKDTPRAMRVPPRKQDTPRGMRPPPFKTHTQPLQNHTNIENHMPNVPRKKRTRQRTSKMENTGYQYAPTSQSLYTEIDVEYNDQDYRENRPWGRGRYTGQNSQSQGYEQQSNAFKYGESISIPIADIVESDCDTRQPGVVENFDLRDIYTDEDTDTLGDSFSKSNASSKYSLKKHKSVVSLDSEDNKLIQERWERAAMVEGMRSTVGRGEGHVCVCRVCAEILLLPDDSFYEAIDRGSEVDTTGAGDMTPEEKELQQEEWRKELVKLEDEIHTLQSVLHTKVRVASELKRKLGITPMTEFKDDFRTGVKTITDSGAYKKTNEQLTKLNESITNSQAYQKTNDTLTSLNDSIQKSDAYQKTSDAFKSLGAWSSKKLGDARNSTVFKSVEEKVGGAYSNVKQSKSFGNLKAKMTRVAGSKSDNNFQELQESDQCQDANGSAPTSTVSTPTTDTSTPTQQVPM